MSNLKPANPNFEHAIRKSFAKQGVMGHIGATLSVIEPGYVEITVPYHDDLSQQHGFFHGGIVGMIADSAGGYAAFSLMAVDDGILTVEYKINLVAPADGDLLIARAKVVRPGRTLTVSQAEVFVTKAGQETLCGIMQQTLMRIVGRPEVTG